MLKVLILSLLVTAGIGLAGAEIYTFNAFPVIDHCQLEWNTGVETNLSTFVIERAAEDRNFTPVGRVEAKGSYSEYQFTDTVPLAADVERTFFYRLKMVDQDGTVRYSETRDVSLTFNTVQHTWGSIKAMFR
ncbi:hypothetical protein HZB60_01120 [candidate division KSB1 bacterium]|nr:hypothetical protein [candidate division KSB1 bacterium]